MTERYECRAWHLELMFCFPAIGNVFNFLLWTTRCAAIGLMLNIDIDVLCTEQILAYALQDRLRCRTYRESNEQKINFRVSNGTFCD